MFVILIASFVLAIFFALSVKRPERKVRRRRTVSVETTPTKQPPVATIDESVETIEEIPHPVNIVNENIYNQDENVVKKGRKKIFVPNGFAEETRVLVFRTNKP